MAMSVRQIRLQFLGTRGEIELRSPRHRWHSALLVQCQEARIMLDCGADWLGRVARLRPSAILLTHAHPDHAAGLTDGAPCPVYATAETWDRIGGYPIAERRTIEAGQRFCLGSVTWQAFELEHSIRAPAVGYRLTAGRTALFYAPDVAAILDQKTALDRVMLYIGDGASIVRPLLRRRGQIMIGHASIQAQLDWCQKEGIAQAVFTHCGSQIVGADGRSVAARIRCFGREHGIAARIAYDGLSLIVP
jgi:phosphoribosyl 1,2-cyclic phosphodiesterase